MFVSLYNEGLNYSINICPCKGEVTENIHTTKCNHNPMTS